MGLENIYLHQHLGLKLAAVPKQFRLNADECWGRAANSQAGITMELMDFRGSSVTQQVYSLHMTPYNMHAHFSNPFRLQASKVAPVLAGNDQTPAF